MKNGAFGYRFPEHCTDPGNENAPCGCDEGAFQRVLAAEVPQATWPLSPEEVPQAPVIMDILEFRSRAVSQPFSIYYHSYMRHNHLRWDREEGLSQFVGEVNTLFARNGIAFELSSDGQAWRLLPEPVARVVGGALFNTGDAETNRLLETARQRISLPKKEDRQEALEKLWDAFERLKTLEPGDNKKAQAEALMNRVALPGSRFREALGVEAKALTEIGNEFNIRHWETNKSPLDHGDQIDYLFIRMFGFIRLVLKATGRGG